MELSRKGESDTNEYGYGRGWRNMLEKVPTPHAPVSNVPLLFVEKHRM